MKALILNSGMGRRMGILASEHPKCMTELSGGETILSRQLKQILSVGIHEVIITTGLFDSILVNYCKSLELPLQLIFVKNPLYRETNYIYSIYCAKEYLDDDIILMHGDLVFENMVFDMLMASQKSCMIVSSTLELPEKDFKAVIQDEKILKIGIEFFNEAVAAQPLYKIMKNDWKIWLKQIITFCKSNQVTCYAENAFNQVSDQCNLYLLDIKNSLCGEIDNPQDLAVISAHLKEVESHTVYMCFSTDILHSGHIAIIRKAQRLGKLIIGVLSDEAVSSYKRFPILPFTERKIMFENIKGVFKVIEQKTLSYKENLEKYKPTYVVHGDDWCNGFQKPIRDDVVSILSKYGGRLVEFPFSKDKKYENLEKRTRMDLSLPDLRRSRLRKIIAMKKMIIALEAHSGLTGLIVENTVVYQKGEAYQFDAIWISSLCDSAAKGKPNIEFDITSRFRTMDDVMEVTTKPIIFDGDTGGLTEHFVYTIRTLERLGVSMVIIRDGKDFHIGAEDLQESVPNFCFKIIAGKKAQKTADFMICAKIESLVLGKGVKDALKRAFAFIEAGADAIMIPVEEKKSYEIFEFLEEFRKKDKNTLIIAESTLNTITEDEFKKKGVNIIIYTNQLTRTGFLAMKKAAELILEHHRAKECNDICMPFEEITSLIP